MVQAAQSNPCSSWYAKQSGIPYITQDENINSLISREGILIHSFKLWIIEGEQTHTHPHTQSLTASPPIIINTFPMGNTHAQENLYKGHIQAERAQICSQPHSQRSFRIEHEASRILNGANLWFMDREKLFFWICSIWHWPHHALAERRQKRSGKVVKHNKPFLEWCNQWT